MIVKWGQLTVTFIDILFLHAERSLGPSLYRDTSKRRGWAALCRAKPQPHSSHVGSAPRKTSALFCKTMKRKSELKFLFICWYCLVGFHLRKTGKQNYLRNKNSRHPRGNNVVYCGNKLWWWGSGHVIHGEIVCSRLREQTVMMRIRARHPRGNST